MEIIIGIIVVLVVLGFLYGVLCVIIRKWPALIWILGISIGGVVGVATVWWVGCIVGLFVIGFLAHAESSDGHRCAHCGSYDTEVIQKDGNFVSWQCNKCNNVTYHN